MSVIIKRSDWWNKNKCRFKIQTLSVTNFCIWRIHFVYLNLNLLILLRAGASAMCQSIALNRSIQRRSTSFGFCHLVIINLKYFFLMSIAFYSFFLLSSLCRRNEQSFLSISSNWAAVLCRNVLLPHNRWIFARYVNFNCLNFIHFII